MYSEEIENLIEFAIANGDLTEKKKSILLKKAEAACIDLDEFEMVLDAKLFEKKQSLKKATTSIATTISDNFVEEKKCKSCGANVDQLLTSCGECGHQYINVESNNSIQKLFQLLVEAENTRKLDTSSLTNSIFGGIEKMLQNEDPVIEKKKTIINGFPIPTTKVDIVEFLINAIPSAKSKGNFFTKDDSKYHSHNELAPVWRSKCEQIIMKARFSLKDDKKMLEEINRYATEIGIK
jgi:hypothetical protein